MIVIFITMNENIDKTSKSKLNNKNSDWYKYYSSDFKDSRKLQFSSIFYQAQEAIINPEIHSVLEFGSGRNSTKALVEHFGIVHKSVDYDNITFYPDEVSLISEYQDEKKYDLVSAFQVLEHNPLEGLKDDIIKMKSFSNKYIYVSLPYSGRWFSFSFNFSILPKLVLRKNICFSWPRWFLKKSRDIEKYKKVENPYKFHWWEIGDKNCSKKEIENIFQSLGLKIEKRFHNEYFPYHLFYLMSID